MSLRVKIFTYILFGLACLMPVVSPAMALILGTVLGLTLGNPWGQFMSNLSKTTLKISVIGLGFGVNIHQVITTGKMAIGYTAAGILFAMVMGYFLGRLFKTEKNTSLLISTGTAICGGSAIAAMAPAIKANNHDIAVSMATVFLLNGAALLVFPVIGHWFDLSQEAFGIWSAMAIHDTSSVVGAASGYGDTALDIGVTFKLTRALWILPLTFIVASIVHGKGKAAFPLFLVGFLLASIASSFWPALYPYWYTLTMISKQLLSVTLFLIGACVTRELLKRVGPRPLFQGVILWALVSILSLYAILQGWIH